MPDLQEIPYNLRIRKKKNTGPDNLLAGLIIGLLFPTIGVLILYFFWGGGDVKNYVSMFFDIKSSRINVASKILSLAMFTNLIPFYFFLNKKKYRTARGIILSMFIYGIIILLYKFVF